MTSETKPSGSPLWSVRLGEVTLALLRNRYALRRTARRAGDQRLAQRLRRFARRRQSAVAELERMSPELETVIENQSASAVPGLRGEARRAFEASSFAAAIASNRRLRVALERALEAGPPSRVVSRLETLRQDADREASVLSARLQELTAAEPDPGTTS